MDETQFREKLFDAFADDERLDSLEARLNDFAHVPGRWRTASSSARAQFNVFEDDDWLKMDPQTMDEEEYAEWIRMGMYRYVVHSVQWAMQTRSDTGKRTRTNMQSSRDRRLHGPHDVPKKRLAKKRRHG